MNTNIIIRLIITAILFVVAWNLENSFSTWLCFSLGFVTIVYPFFLGKDNK